MTYDPLKLSSGLLDDDDVTFEDAIFRTDPEFRDGQVLFLDATLKTSDGETTNQYFGTGNGWESLDDGQTATREDGRDIAFNKNAKIGELYGGLLAVMKDDPKADQAVRARVQDFPLGPRDAGFWKGLRVHISAEDRKGGGEVSDYSALVITEFHGFEGQDAAPAKKVAKKATAAAKKTVAKKDDAGDDAPVFEATIRAQLDAIADESGSHDEFMEAALEALDDMTPAQKAEIASKADGSIWADAVKRYEATQ